MEFDADEWARLAREDPEEFQRRRQALIEEVIAQAPARVQDRLRGLQCRVDLELRKARTPLAGALRLQSMMWDQFEQLRAALNGELPLTRTPENAETTTDNVVPFIPRR